MLRYLSAAAFVFAGIAMGAVCGAPALADEAAGFRLAAGMRPERPVPPVPMRLAETLALEPMARIATAASAEPGKLAAMERHNADRSRLRQPLQVGFSRDLPTALALRLMREELRDRVGSRLGDGFLGREPSGDYVWGTSVEVPGARALRIELSDVELPEGTRFWVYGGHGESRAFDLRLRTGSGTLLTPAIDGERIHLEVQLPDGAIVDGQGFVVRTVQELTVSRRALAPLATLADACIRNGECFDGDDFPAIENARDGVLQYLFESEGNSYTCSGGLLDDNAPSTLEPWILTANHCLSTQAEADTVDSAFFFRYADCAGNSPEFTFGPLGADLMVTSATTDVTLLRAADPGEVPVGAYYLPWTSIRPGNNTVLHRLSHPVSGASGDILPQSYSTQRIDTSPDFVCDGAPTSNFLHSVNLGGTGVSGGSSGSPVLRSDGYVVGQLLGTCGSNPDGCGGDENVLDGALSASYPLLRPYLSPAASICTRDADTACLLNGRFAVEVSWETSNATGSGRLMSFNGQRAENVESAFFWFFNATNFEMGVKMVDACTPPFNRFWVFVSGLTSQGFTVRVTQMSTGEVRTYGNGVGEIPTTEADTNAFTCP